MEWLANITNRKTGRLYKIDVTEFVAFTGSWSYTGEAFTQRRQWTVALSGNKGKDGLTPPPHSFQP